MSWIVAGTVPFKDFPLVDVPCDLAGDRLLLGARTIPIARGTAALLAAAVLTARRLEREPPRAVLAGDRGRGEGSALVYGHLIEKLGASDARVMVFHYLQPDLDWHNRILINIDELERRPILVADAGYMYIAKMSGFSSSYDLFTPDPGEMAFLADQHAPHPFYTRGFLLQDDQKIPELISRAYRHENASRYLLVKGRCDYVASGDGVIDRVCEPCVESLEPIGGTGDTVTGIAAALIESGRSIPEACLMASGINRFMGVLAKPTPASSIGELIAALPEALELELSRRP